MRKFVIRAEVPHYYSKEIEAEDYDTAWEMAEKECQEGDITDGSWEHDEENEGPLYLSEVVDDDNWVDDPIETETEAEEVDDFGE